ncbi:cell division control protein 1 [[Candida] railenensis]|uniref:Cell division control protein 1 n=1 Tax=[Candida] railenensis TaxID=45579 RepID=A0A9P0VXB0_9ASCO|nr:cell division control protein 1 [[Candida] railenensis]
MRFNYQRSINQLLVSLTVLWLVVFIFYERYVPYLAAKSCSWPKVVLEPPARAEGQQDPPPVEPIVVEQKPAEKEQMEAESLPQNSPAEEEQAEPPVEVGIIERSVVEEAEKYRDLEDARIMLIADPQLIDAHTYPGRNSLLLKLSQHTVDTYIKKSYNALMKYLEPEHIFFLGDLLDNGRESEDGYFQSQVKRFKKIFKKHESTYTFHTNVPGNHDIGFGDNVIVKNRDRFEETFGQMNTRFTICEVEFVAMDTVSLSSDKKEVNEKAFNFLDHVAQLPKERPRILLTHVPLYRDPEVQKCGPLRESAEFKLGSGYQYQNAINEKLSSEILQKIEPDMIFSGDDHDYCDVTHVEGRTREITVKSISMAMGISYPAVQLLTLVLEKESNQVHYETEICYLPTPYVNIYVYVVLAIFSGLAIITWNIKSKSAHNSYSSLSTSSKSKSKRNTAGTSSGGVGSLGSSGDEEHGTSIKLSNFLRGQDSDDNQINLTPLPLYTFTQKEGEGSTKLKRAFLQVGHFLRRWNLIESLKHSALLGTIVIGLYYIGFCCTL